MRSLMELFAIALLLVSSVVRSGAEKATLPQTNLLFIMYDDLRPELSVYGKKHMITPNFERLAEKSVVFDIAISQVAVCNPSRDSLLTGLRPDTMSTYNFQNSYYPNKILPEVLIKAGYKTAGFGKIRHWDGPDKNVWTDEQHDGTVDVNRKTWYDYQTWEWQHMNSTVMPDRQKAEEKFPDYILASKVVDRMRKFKDGPNYWMTAVGFKMPHLSLHVPHRFFQMYENTTHVWEDTDPSRLRYPPTTPAVSYRCCADTSFKYMNPQNGGESFGKSRKQEPLGDMSAATTKQMYTEMMQGYSAAVSFVDEQLGRVLDAIDEMQLWNNLTVVLTADHGMHNGEKGLWEKWSLFDESTRVPLIIAHPKSPFKNTHFFEPVELLDVYPTVLDLVSAPHLNKRAHAQKMAKNLRGNPAELYKLKLKEPGGKSLAPHIVGGKYALPHAVRPKRDPGGHSSHRTQHHFAVSQMVRCANKNEYEVDRRTTTDDSKKFLRSPIWTDCELSKNEVGRARQQRDIHLMGYSLRTTAFRYTLWLHFDPVKQYVRWNEPIFDEELYDHRTEELGGLTHFETENVAKIPEFERTLVEQRQTLINFIQNKIVFKMGNDPEYLAAKANFTSQNQEVIDGIAQQKHDEKALKKFIQNSADAGGTSA